MTDPSSVDIHIPLPDGKSLRAALVLPGGVEHSAYCGPDGALVLDVFRPVREDYRERWVSEG